MKPPSFCLLILFGLTLPYSLAANTLQVGPGKPFAKPCAAIAAASSGDRIEIDTAGNYAGDVCQWSTSNLAIVGVGPGRAVIDAAGSSAQGKAIWVISGNNTTIENIEFTGATVPDMNGAGIRQEGNNVTIRNCYFHDNQDGILSDGGNSTILIEFSEFYHNGAGDGFSHNLYIGNVARFIFRYNYSHGAIIGHLLKSRAAENDIYYNRFSDESTGTASYDIDLPNGGLSFIVGNLIEKGPQAQNSSLIAYQEEGASAGNPNHQLFVINNTMVNDFGRGTFVYVDGSVSASATIKNNVFQGSGSITSQSSAIQSNNFSGNALLVGPSTYDYHLQSTSPAINAGAAPGSGAGVALAPTFQYVHPSCAEGRALAGSAIDIGAYEFNGGTGVPPANAPSRCGGSSNPAPGVAFSPVSLAFASQLVGTSSAGQSILLTNPGDASLTISSILISGADSSDFAQTNTCGSSLAIASSCSLTVVFSPSATGTRSASLVITDNASGSPHSVSLTGMGAATAPAASISPVSLTFASQSVGTTSQPQFVTLSNSGSASLVISSISTSGAFAQTNTCGSSLSAGSTCKISVTFTPLSPGTQTGTISVADNAPGSPHLVSLSGTAPGAAPTISLSPTTLSFSPQLVGSSSIGQPIKLANTGSASLSISAITLSGDFSQANNCGSAVAANASCVLTVTFKPVAGGNRTGTLSIADNAAGSPHKVTLSGKGQDFSLSVSSSSASVNAGSTASFNLALSPDGGFNQTISLACSGAPAQSVCTLTPSSVAPSGSTVSTVAVSVSTTARLGALPFPGLPFLPTYLWQILLWTLLLLICLICFHRGGRHRRLAIGLATAALLIATVAGCAGSVATNQPPSGQNPGTPAGSYTLTVTATSGSLSHSTKLTLNVN